MRKKSIAILICSLLLVLTAPPAFAAHPGQECKSSQIDIDFTKALSIEFGNISLSTCDVTNHREKNFGYGEMAIAQGLSSISDVPLSRIMQMRTEQKMGWGKIAKEIGVKVSDAVHRSTSVLEKVGLSGEAARIRVNIDLSDEDNGKEHNNGKKPDKNQEHNSHKKQGHK